MTPPSITWGNTTLTLEHPEFREGFVTGRWYYFAFYLKDKLTEQQAATMSSTDILNTIGVRNEETGTYALDYEGQAHIAQMIGTIAGFLSGPLLPETEEERNQRASAGG